MKRPIKRINPPTLPYSDDMGYSQISIVETGSLAYVSSQTVFCHQANPKPTELDKQTKLALENIQAALDALNATTDDIVIFRCFIVNLTPERFDIIWPVIKEFFGSAKPSISGFGVAALVLEDTQVEFECVVRVPD